MQLHHEKNPETVADMPRTSTRAASRVRWDAAASIADDLVRIAACLANTTIKRLRSPEELSPDTSLGRRWLQWRRVVAHVGHRLGIDKDVSELLGMPLEDISTADAAVQMHEDLAAAAERLIARFVKQSRFPCDRTRVAIERETFRRKHTPFLNGESALRLPLQQGDDLFTLTALTTDHLVRCWDDLEEEYMGRIALQVLIEAQRPMHEAEIAEHVQPRLIHVMMEYLSWAGLFGRVRDACGRTAYCRAAEPRPQPGLFEVDLRRQPWMRVVPKTQPAIYAQRDEVEESKSDG